jgi:hypothetical protein
MPKGSKPLNNGEKEKKEENIAIFIILNLHGNEFIMFSIFYKYVCIFRYKCWKALWKMFRFWWLKTFSPCKDLKLLWLFAIRNPPILWYLDCNISNVLLWLLYPTGWITYPCQVTNYYLRCIIYIVLQELVWSFI